MTAPTARSLATRLFVAALGSSELMTIYVGVRLGFYLALAEAPATSAALVAATGCNERYVREWLEQQAAAAILSVDDTERPPRDRLYTLSAGYAEALTDPDSPNYIAPLAVLPVGALASVLPELLDACRSGSGVAYGRFGSELRGAELGLNNTVFRKDLVGWIKDAMPDVSERLAAPGSAIADVACGSGASSIALALGYPECRVDGFDVDRPSIVDARAAAARAGVADRTVFHELDAASLLGSDRQYDLVCLLDALHDMPRPVEVLRACRALCESRSGAVLLMEPRVEERYTAPAAETERFFHAISLLHCLPAGMVEPDSAATGAMIRPSIVRGYAARAGFSRVKVLPIEHTFHRLFRLS